MIVAVICGVLGLLVGNLLTVVVDRVPDRVALRRPPARCRGCQAPLARTDTIPVASWLALGRRCRHCRRAIPLTEPLVEVATTVLFVLAALRFGPSLVLVPVLVLFACLVAVTAVDLACSRIPDRIVFPTLGASLVLIVAVSVIEGVPSAVGPALIGAAAYFVALFVPHLVSPRGMGFGDVKLALVLGLFLGWLGGSGVDAVRLVLFALIAGSLIGVAAGVVVLALRRRNAAFPFGPALALGTVLVVLLADTNLTGA